MHVIIEASRAQPWKFLANQYAQLLEKNLFTFLALEFQTFTDLRLRNNTYHFSKWRFHSQISCSRQTRGLLIYDVRSALYQGKHYLEVYYDRRTVCDPMTWNKRHVYSYDRKTCKRYNNSKIRLLKPKVLRVFINREQSSRGSRNYFGDSAQPAKMDLNKKSLPKFWSVQTMIFGS